MTTRRRPDPVLFVFELWCHFENGVRRIDDAVRGRKCPICLERSRHLEAHIHVNHNPEGM